MTTSDRRTATVPDPLVRRASIAVVFAGADPHDPVDHPRLRRAVARADPVRTIVIAADSGLHEAVAGGWAVDLVIGDLDSVDPDRLADARRAGAQVDRHPAAKDATDLELALDAALAAGADQVVVASGRGGRFDHLLANVALLAGDRSASVPVSALLGPVWIHVVRREVAWEAERGELVTLLPVHGPVGGVTTSGLLYPLVDATLEPGSTRGVSNEQLDPVASVAVATGALVVVLPGALGTHVLAADVADAPDPSFDPAVGAEVARPPEPPDPGGPRVP
jgi:thiamine pyrophosphokinase